MALFRRPREDGEPSREDGEPSAWVPTDDAVDFHISEQQWRIRKNAETRKVMARLWEQIQERLRDPWRQP